MKTMTAMLNATHVAVTGNSQRPRLKYPGAASGMVPRKCDQHGHAGRAIGEVKRHVKDAEYVGDEAAGQKVDDDREEPDPDDRVNGGRRLHVDRAQDP